MIDEIHKNRGHKVKSQKGKANRRNSIRGTQRFTKPSPTVGDAKVQINSETSIPLLEKLKQKYIGTCNPYGFINDLRDALGIPTSKGSSKYGVVQIPTDNGILESSICITNHNANAENYITYGCNLPYNLRLLIRKEFQTNRFHPHKDVKLDEYVYYAKRMQKVENPLCQIIDSLINFLKTGQYKDTTGVAFLNQSPSTEIENNQNINCNRNMSKKLIRLTENDLHRIVKESVQHIISEASVAPNGFKHRFDPKKKDGDYPLEQPEWTKDPRWQGWKGEDPEWIMKQQKESGDPYYGNKQPVRVSEAQLHQIVKESVEKVMNEGWFGNDAKYGEKWYNPLTWVSDKEKTRIDQAERERKKQLRDIDRRKAEREKEDAEGYRRWRQSEAEKAQRKYAQNYSSGLACHAGEYYDPMGTSSYDAGLR